MKPTFITCAKWCSCIPFAMLHGGQLHHQVVACNSIFPHSSTLTTPPCSPVSSHFTKIMMKHTHLCLSRKPADRKAPI